METPIIQFEEGGICCDNDACDYFDDTVLFSQLKDFVNKPCPKCGSNLLTEEDYKAAVTFRKMGEKLNSMPKEVVEALLKTVNVVRLPEDEENAQRIRAVTDKIAPDDLVHVTLKFKDGIQVLDVSKFEEDNKLPDTDGEKKE